MKGRGPHHPFKLSGVVLENNNSVNNTNSTKVKKSFKIAKRKLFTLYYMAYEKNFSRCHRKGK